MHCNDYIILAQHEMQLTLYVNTAVAAASVMKLADRRERFSPAGWSSCTLQRGGWLDLQFRANIQMC